MIKGAMRQRVTLYLGESRREGVLSPEEFRERCRKSGLSLTRQRELIWEILAGRRDHPTADQVYDEAKERMPHLSRMSVFRILDTFCEIGLVHRVASRASVAHYDADTSRHCHRVCRHCGRISDWRYPLFDKIPLPESTEDGFALEDFWVTFYGECRQCRERAESGPVLQKREGL